MIAKILKAIFKPKPIPSPEQNKMRVNDRGLALIKHFEGCLKPIGGGKFEAYADPAHGWSVPTIGWGTIAYENGTRVKRGDVITQARADELLAWEVEQKADAVRRLVKVPLTADQFSALVSFAYNVGEGNLAQSTLLRNLNDGDPTGAADEFRRWNRAGGEVMKGLTRRRESERRLFLGFADFIVKL